MSQGARRKESIGMRDIAKIGTGRTDTEGTENEREVAERTDIEATDIVRKHVERTDTEMMTALAVEEGILVLLNINLLPS